MVTSTIAGGVAAVVIDNPPVNVLSHAVRIGLSRALAEAIDDPAAIGIAIVGAGHTFPAGADIREFNAPLAPPSLGELHAMIEASPKPVIAVMHGTTLGGGLELAFACHWRISRVDARHGLPEIKLGLFPAGGGTQRLARLAGPEIALDLILSGRQIDTQEALKLGLTDASFESDPLAAAYEIARDGRFQSLRRVRDMVCSPARSNAFQRARKELERTAHDQVAPFAVLRCMELASELPFDAARREEGSLAAECLSSPQHTALKHLFFAERDAARPPLPAPVPPPVLGNVATSVPKSGVFDAERLSAAGLVSRIANPTARKGADAVPPDGPSPVDLILSAAGPYVECRLDGRHSPTPLIRLRPLQPIETTRLVEVLLLLNADAEAVWSASALIRRIGLQPVFTWKESIALRMRDALCRAIGQIHAAGHSRTAIMPALVKAGFDRDLAFHAIAHRYDLPGADLAEPEDEYPADREIVTTCLAALTREAADVLDRGTAMRPGDIDVITVAATGFPRHLGGPLHRSPDGD